MSWFSDIVDGVSSLFDSGSGSSDLPFIDDSTPGSGSFGGAAPTPSSDVLNNINPSSASQAADLTNQASNSSSLMGIAGTTLAKAGASGLAAGIAGGSGGGSRSLMSAPSIRNSSQMGMRMYYGGDAANDGSSKAAGATDPLSVQRYWTSFMQEFAKTGSR